MNASKVRTILTKYGVCKELINDYTQYVFSNETEVISFNEQEVKDDYDEFVYK